MGSRRKQIRWNLTAFALFFFVSLYRRVSMHLWPDDPARTTVLYLGYLALTAAWAFSLRRRLVQKNTRRFLLAEDGVILAGLTLRYVQDTFWTEDPALVRGSGLWLAASLPVLALLGVCAALGVGQPDEYRIPRRWSLAAIPIAALILLVVSDETLHFFFSTVPGEPHPDLEFRPGYGILLLYLVTLLLLALRSAAIYRRNSLMDGRRALRMLLALLGPIAGVVVTVPYLLVTTGLVPQLAGVEVIELFAKIYYVEVVSWEAAIYFGLVPTNSDYEEIFLRSTASMQLILRDGTRLLSEGAEPISDRLLAVLTEKGAVSLPDGQEMDLFSMPDADFVWTRDVSRLRNAVRELSQSAEALAQEGALLEEELRTQNEKVRLRVKHEIYDDLVREVNAQLRLMGELAKKEASDALLRQMCVLGTYVKRRCNLRLAQRERGHIGGEDLFLSLRDMAAALELSRIKTELVWEPAAGSSDDFACFLFDTLENALEHTRFQAKHVRVAVEGARASLCLEGFDGPPFPEERAGTCQMRVTSVESGFRAELWEEADHASF